MKTVNDPELGDLLLFDPFPPADLACFSMFPMQHVVFVLIFCGVMHMGRRRIPVKDTALKDEVKRTIPRGKKSVLQRAKSRSITELIDNFPKVDLLIHQRKLFSSKPHYFAIISVQSTALFLDLPFVQWRAKLFFANVAVLLCTNASARLVALARTLGKGSILFLWARLSANSSAVNDEGPVSFSQLAFSVLVIESLG